MAQIIEQSDKFGKIGKAFGQGLGEQIPKEVERYRLSEGLKNFEQEAGGLTPLQQQARLSAIPGITPQMIQSFGDLAKQQGIRGAYGQLGQRGNRGESISASGEQQIPTEMLDKIMGTGRKGPSEMANSAGDNVPRDSSGQPQIVDKNPLRPEAQPRNPWTAERRNEEISQVYQDFPWVNQQEAQSIAADNEARELAQPEAEQKKDAYLKGVQKEANQKFMEQLQTKLDRIPHATLKDENVFRDISGDMLVNLQRGMERDLRTNPNISMDDIVNKWTNKASDLAKANIDLETEANKIGLDNIFNKDRTLQKIKGYQKIFANADNSEEFSKKLQTLYHLSPQGAATEAYPVSSGVQSFLSGVTPTKVAKIKDAAANSRSYATEIEKHLTSKDSIQGIARELSNRDALFDQDEFFQQLTADLDNIRLTPRQQREVAKGARDRVSTWGDVFVLPLSKGGIK